MKVQLSNSLFGIVLAAAITTVACGEKDPSFSLLSDSDIFRQGTDTVRSKIDIMWVIDNSGSMETSQQNVITNLSSFIADFQTKNLDFKMAVTTTDAFRTYYTGNQNCSQFRNRILTSSCNVPSNTIASPFRILDNLSPDLQANFLINARQTDEARGIYGTGDERAFQSIRAALDQPLNAGFLRADSYLAVIIVSDEDDFSHSSSQSVESMGGAYATNPWSYPNLHTVQSYTDYLDALTNTTAANRRYNVNAMAIFDEPCRVALTTPSFQRKIGQRYAALADATEGIKSSLCGNFATELELIADNILTLATQFYLDRIPKPETIVVKINNVVIPERNSNPLADGGWEYDPTTNSIKFYGSSYIPPAGALISIKYDPLAYGS